MNFRNRVVEILSKAEVERGLIAIKLNENIFMQKIEEVNNNIEKSIATMYRASTIIILCLLNSMSSYVHLAKPVKR